MSERTQRETDNALVCCLDLIVPEDARMRIWCENGEARLHEAGRRVFVYATPSARIFLMGIPVWNAEDAEQVREWYRKHPVVRPTYFEVSETGEALLLPESMPLPVAVYQDAELRRIHALFDMKPPAQAEAETMEPVASEPGDVQPVEVVDESPGLLVLPELAGAQPMCWTLEGSPARATPAGVFASPGSAFIVAWLPDPMVSDRESLGQWFAARPEARITGWLVDENGQAHSDLSVLDLFERSSELPAPWPDILSVSRAAVMDEVIGRAVHARELRNFVSEHGVPPEAILGSRGTLYVPLISGATSEIDTLHVRGVVPEGTPAHVLRFETPPVDGEGALSHIFAPVGADYVITSKDAHEIGDQSSGIRIRPDGRWLPLSVSDRMRVWSQGEVLERIEALPVRNQERPLAVSPLPADPVASLEPESYKPMDVSEDVEWAEIVDYVDESQPYEPSPEELAAVNVAFDNLGREPTISVGESSDRGSGTKEKSGRAPLRAHAHSPYEGTIHLGNWMLRSPRGELWLSELLDVLADSPSELDALGCLVPIRLLRQGLQIAAVDKELLQRAVTQHFASRLAKVRVFEVGGRTYFGRETDAGVRLVGPRGQEVRSEEVRTAIAEVYGRNPQSCFAEAVTPTLGRRRGR